MIQPRRFNRRQRVALYIAQEGRCANPNCKAELESGYHADHVKPWSKGGITDVVNGQGLCPKCNLMKGNKYMKPRNWQDEFIDRYETLNKRDFLLVAAPASGKTYAVAKLAKQLLDQGICNAVLFVVPRADLCEQAAIEFAKHEIQINPNWGGTNNTFVGTKFRGAAVTYQWLLGEGNTQLARTQMGLHKVFVILDEPHHCSDESKWGERTVKAIGEAERRLLMTGTCYRSDQKPIPYVTYVRNNEGKKVPSPDYEYTLGRALREDEPVLRMPFFPRSDGLMEWIDEGGLQKASFKDDVDEKGKSRRLRTALDPNFDHMKGMIDRGMQRLKELREDDPDAACLIISMDIGHAESLVKLVQSRHRIDPKIVTSKDPKSGDVIRSFKEKGCKDPCIVSVDMLNEGTNIPRIRVVIYATNVVTELYFTQSYARAMRVEEDHDDHTCYIVIPDDPRIVAHATNVIDICEHALKDETKCEGTGGNRPSGDLFFQTIGSTFERNGTIAGDTKLSEDNLVFARSVKERSLSKRTEDEIASILHAANAFSGNYSSSKEESSDEEPHYKKLKKLRDANHKTVSRICGKHGRNDYDEIHKRLNALVGIWSVKQCDDLEKLTRRLEIASGWHMSGVPND